MRNDGYIKDPITPKDDISGDSEYEMSAGFWGTNGPSYELNNEFVSGRQQISVSTNAYGDVRVQKQDVDGGHQEPYLRERDYVETSVVKKARNSIVGLLVVSFIIVSLVELAFIVVSIVFIASSMGSDNHISRGNSGYSVEPEKYGYEDEGGHGKIYKLPDETAAVFRQLSDDYASGYIYNSSMDYRTCYVIQELVQRSIESPWFVEKLCTADFFYLSVEQTDTQALFIITDSEKRQTARFTFDITRENDETEIKYNTLTNFILRNHRDNEDISYIQVKVTSEGRIGR